MKTIRQIEIRWKWLISIIGSPVIALSGLGLIVFSIFPFITFSCFPFSIGLLLGLLGVVGSLMLGLALFNSDKY